MVSVRSKQLSKCPNLFQAVMVEPDRAHTHTHTEAQFSAPAQGFTQDNSTSIHHERFYKVRSKNL